MRRSVPLWALAVLPATLVGHALAYALMGRAIADGRHAYFVPALDLSLALLAVLGLLTLGGALLRRRVLALDARGSIGSYWIKLAPLQIATFTVLERSEGHGATVEACLVQIAVALFAAVLLVCFARLLSKCVRVGEAAATYLHRFLAPPLPAYLHRTPVSLATALFAHAGSSRFQRPPPAP